MWQWLLNLLFPERCVHCGVWQGLLCRRCVQGMRRYPQQEIPAGLDGAAVGWIFEGALQRAIHQLKYQRVRRVAIPLGTLLAELWAAQRITVDAVIAVPLHRQRLAERGFNQAEEIARALATRHGIALLPGLFRERDTGHQARLSRVERRSNISGAFRWRAAQPPPPRVLLVDDVLTTGATLEECGQLLLRVSGTRLSLATMAMAINH